MILYLWIRIHITGSLCNKLYSLPEQQCIPTDQANIILKWSWCDRPTAGHLLGWRNKWRSFSAVTCWITQFLRKVTNLHNTNVALEIDQQLCNVRHWRVICVTLLVTDAYRRNVTHLELYLLEASVEVVELVDLADKEVAVPPGNLRYRDNNIDK